MEAQDSLLLFTQTTQAFTDATTTEADQLNAAIAQVEEVFARLGLEIPETVEDFNKLVLGLDKTSKSGVNAFFALSDISDEFEKFLGAQTENIEAVEEQTESTKEATKEVKALSPAIAKAFDVQPVLNMQQAVAELFGQQFDGAFKT